MAGRRSRTKWAQLYGWLAERLYHELAWGYDLVSWLVSAGHWAAWRRAALTYLPPGRVLEVGFGTGALLIELASRGRDVVGLDLSPEMHRETARKLRQRSLQIPRVRAPTQTMPFATGTFDALLSTFPAGYILDPATLREAARLLRPGGRFVVAGLWLQIDLPWLAWLLQPIYGAAAPLLAHFQATAAAAGLQMTIVEAGQGRIRLPVVLLTSEAPCIQSADS